MAEEVWQWFLELRAAAPNSGFGPSPITYTELAAWSMLVGVDLRRWEVTAIRAMDAAALRALLTKESSPGG